jgi:methylmalonyl-CoA/ethylmalonyl-CoA epimerase
MAQADDATRIPAAIANDSDVAVTQISVVVPELEEGIRTYAAAFGWSPWRIFDFDELAHEDVQVHGRNEDYRIRVALTTAGNVDVELIEPVGPSPYRDFLDTAGGGLHHVQLVSPTRSVTSILDAHRSPVICSGTFRLEEGDKFGYAIYDARQDLRFVAGAYAGDVGELVRLPHRVVTVRNGEIEVHDGPEPPARTSTIDVIQVGLVVEDLDEVIGALREVVGWGPWRVYDFRNVDHTNTTYRGKPASYAMRIATVQAGGLHVEVIAPTGPGPYQDFLDENGPGLHHLQVRGEDPSEAGRRLEATGATVHMSGRVGIDENSGLDYALYEGGGLRHLVEVTVGDRGRLMAVLPYEIVAGS